MRVLAHLGIGLSLSRPLLKDTHQISRKRMISWVLLGTLFPDLLDKTLYYGLTKLTGKHGEELWLVTGTRTIGHTLLLTVLVWMLGRWKKWPQLVFLSLGMATHLFLDQFGDFLYHYVLKEYGPVYTQKAHEALMEGIVGLLWPFCGNRFPAFPYSGGLIGQIKATLRLDLLIPEFLGGTLLIWNLVKESGGVHKIWRTLPFCSKEKSDPQIR